MNRKEYDFATFDIETVGLGGKFLCAGVYLGNTNYRYCSTVKELVAVLFANSKKYVYYAHNGGKYDFRYIIQEIIKDRSLIIKPLIIHGSIAKFSVYKKARKIAEFRDSYFILPSSLKRLTIDFDVEHKKLDFDDYNNPKVTEKMKEYLKHDNIGLYEVLEKQFEIIRSRNLSKIPISTASLSLLDYKTNEKDNYKMIKNIDDPDLRSGYMGGRCEIFKTYFKSENITLKCYDVNSLYPAVMRANKFPIGEYYVSEFPKEKEYIAKISWFCPKDITIPLLAVREDNKLMFVTGFGKGIYSRPEIEKAKELGYTINYEYVYNFKESAFIFTNFIDYWFDIKTNSAGAKKYIAKLMLNSLYGKFGQKRLTQQYIINPDKAWKRKNFDSYDFLDYGDLEIFRKDKKANHKWVNLPIIIYITSLARLRLYNYFEKAGFDKIWYCDTDSIFTTTDLSNYCSQELGYIKLEQEYKECYFIQPKVYGCKNGNDTTIKIKGFNRSEVDFNKIKDIFDNKEFFQDREQIAGFLSTLRRYDSWITNFNVRKRIVTSYSKRKVLDNGDTYPFFRNILKEKYE